MASDDEEIPETGAIFTFGKTRFAENLANKFWIRDDKVLQLACGDEHSAVITGSGRLYTFGSNDWGQLGHGNTKPYTKPSVVKKLKGDRVKVVACGRSHTLVISESGVFSFGAGADSQLGHGDNKSYNVPTEIEALNDHTITQVACGAEHSAALTDNGMMYVWGTGSEGQLGLGVSECEQPTLLKFRSKVTFVACGYYHTAVITELGKLYTFGDNEAGKLGLDDNQCDDTEQPQQVKTLNEPAVFVACGGNHTAVITKRGSLFTFGSGMHGQLGHGPSFQDLPLPKLVSALQGKFVSSVSCGESHTAVLTKNGEMFTFGDGRHGKLGMGDESFSNLFHPTKVGRFRTFYVEQVSCGGCHMLAVAARKHGDIEDSEGSEENVRKEDSGGEDVPDGGETSPRLSQTVPMLGMSARDKRRQKDTEGISLASSLPPLNRSSLPPLASLGIGNIKKEETKPVTNGRLNPLDRSTLPIISIKSPSPDDEENSLDKLSTLRRLPPRPKRRKKKPKPASDSEEENDRKPRGNTTPRPTPLPRRQKQTKENEQTSEDNVRKSRKNRDPVEKSGSEASDEDSEEDNGKPATASPSSSRSFAAAKEGKETGADSRNAENESEDEDSEGEEEDERQEDGEGNDKVEDKGNEKKMKDDEASEEEDEEETEDEESEEDNDEDDEATSSKSNETTVKKESEEVTKVEAVDSGNEDEDHDKKKNKDNEKDSKKDKKDKKKGKTKEDELTGDKEKEKGKKKKKDKKEMKKEADQAEGQEENESGKEENDGTEENERNEGQEGNDKDNKDDKGKKTKKSGICVIL